jgi:hypothetical protein
VLLGSCMIMLTLHKHIFSWNLRHSEVQQSRARSCETFCFNLNGACYMLSGRLRALIPQTDGTFSGLLSDAAYNALRSISQKHLGSRDGATITKKPGSQSRQQNQQQTLIITISTGEHIAERTFVAIHIPPSFGIPSFNW